MIPKKIFRENERIEVFDEIEKIYYKSIIQEVNRDNIAIGVPMGNQEQLFLYKNQVKTFRIIYQDAHYYFKSKILGRKKSNNLLLFLIAWPSEVKRIQQRAFFRFPCSFQIYYWILPAEEAEGRRENKLPFEELVEPLGPPEKGLMADISGGGLQLVTSYGIPKGSILALRLPIFSKKEKRTFEVLGKIVWANTPNNETARQHRHAVEFLDIEEKLREEIIRFIFILSRERVRS